MTKLSDPQKKTLQILADGTPRNARQLNVGLSTIYGLHSRKWISSRAGRGGMAFPRTHIKWFITLAGRAALAEGERT